MTDNQPPATKGYVPNSSFVSQGDHRLFRPSLSPGPPLSRWLPVLAWMGLIFVGSSRSDLPAHPNDSIDTVAKKAIHGVEYGVLAALLWRALAQGKGSARDSLTLKVLGVSLLYALSDELHQRFVPGRGSLVDVLIDGISIVAALAFLRRRSWPASHASREGPIATRSGG